MSTVIPADFFLGGIICLPYENQYHIAVSTINKIKNFFVLFVHRCKHKNICVNSFSPKVCYLPFVIEFYAAGNP